MKNSPEAGSAPAVGPTEKRIVFALLALTLLLAGLPYLLGYSLLSVLPPGTQFIGTVYNIDDYANYLSWLRQTADGHFFLHNLFTTDPQQGLEFNLFFWLLGLVVRVTHIAPQAALQIARTGGGLGLLWLTYRFYRFCLPDDAPARLTALGFACLSSGFGWAQWRVWYDKNPANSPVDAWQPEAYTFLTLYTSALMTVSTLLIVGALYALLLGERTGRWRYPMIAGVCGGLLGNIHSYDVLHIAAAWGLFLIVWTMMKRGRGVAQSWLRGLAALALTLPTTGYMLYVFSRETVFRDRANVKTLSPHLPVALGGLHFLLPAPWHYFLGYGLVFLLALLAVVRLAPPAPNNGGAGEEAAASSSLAPPLLGAGGASSLPPPLLIAACWALGGLAVIYLPFAFQRKMLMGEHIPLCLLAGVGAAWLTRRLAPRVQAVALAALVLASAPSNALFLLRDVRHLEADRSETKLFPYLPADLVNVYGWLRLNAPPDAAVVGPPGLCTYLPGETGRAVWAGHWAETPSYGTKDAEFADAFSRDTPDDARHAFLQSTRAQYLFYPNDVSGQTFTRRDRQHHLVTHQYAELATAPPPYLTPVYKNNTFTVYEIRK